MKGAPETEQLILITPPLPPLFKKWRQSTGKRADTCSIFFFQHLKRKKQQEEEELMAERSVRINNGLFT